MDLYIVAFVIFGFLGWVWESIFCTVRQKKWANRGFLYGPICPIYGFGGSIGLVVYYSAESGLIPDMPLWLVFLAGFAVSIILEYPTSWMLEKLFHARWWDYSGLPLNINGRTSVPTSVAFGLASILIMKLFIPAIASILSLFPIWLMNLLSLLFVSVLSADVTLTVSALTDFQKHISALDEAFQKSMTNTVYNMLNSENRLYNKAISGISVFKFPLRKNTIAVKIKERKLAELIGEYFDSQKRMSEAKKHRPNKH